MTKGIKLKEEQVNFEEGSIEKILFERTRLSKEALEAHHDMFTAEVRDDDTLVFTINRMLSRELINSGFTREHRDEVSYIDIVLSPTYRDAFRLTQSMAHSVNKTIKEGEYDGNNYTMQYYLMVSYAFAWFQAQFEAIKTLKDIQRPVPLPLFVEMMNKQKGMEVAYQDPTGVIFAGRFDRAEIRQSFFSSNLVVKMTIISKGKEGYVEGAYAITLPLIPYVSKIEDLSLIEMTPELKKQFTERGHRYVEYTIHPKHCHCKGFSYRYGGWFGDIRLNINGRVMIDIGAMRALNSNLNDSWYFGNPFGATSYDDDDEPITDSASAVAEEDIWMCSPVVYGFSFGTKDWIRMSIEDISEIKFSDTAFDELIIPDNYKEIFVSCLTNDMPSLDSIEGKGNAKIFLLAGGPGCGKTMTAESVAEALKMPIYYVSVGELGTSPEEMETNLAQVMDVATSWNAIVLLDEVDVFAVKRNGSDIKRNAMTAILLRLLERYNGIMFMTTNLIDNLDQAFISRATATIPYDDLDASSRGRIWVNLLSKAEKLGMAIDQEVLDSVDTLANHDLNGREIKNRIRLAYSVAAGQKDRKITMKIMNSILNIKKATASV